MQRRVLGDGFGAKADPFDWDGFGVHDGAVGVQHDLVFLFGDLSTGQRPVTVGIRDGFAFDPYFFPGDGDLHGLLFGEHVFAETGWAGFHLFGADPQVFLGPRHRLVGVRPGRVISRAPGTSTCPVPHRLTVGHRSSTG